MSKSFKPFTLKVETLEQAVELLARLNVNNNTLNEHHAKQGSKSTFKDYKCNSDAAHALFGQMITPYENIFGKRVKHLVKANTILGL